MSVFPSPFPNKAAGSSSRAHRHGPMFNALSGYQGMVHGPNHANILYVGCPDPRLEGGSFLSFGMLALRTGFIATALPPKETAPPQILALFELRKIKDARHLAFVSHEDCGGILTAMQHPDSDKAPRDVKNMIRCIEATGIDLPYLVHQLMLVCEGDTKKAADLLARHVMLKTIDNVSSYDDVSEQIMTHKLSLLPLHLDLKAGTGELSVLERYDVNLKRWSYVSGGISDELLAHMCDLPDDCRSCESCHHTIEKSLQLEPAVYLSDEREIETAYVPVHIARLLRERQSTYQPQLAAHNPHAHASIVQFHAEGHLHRSPSAMGA